jgi:hypothetical protein
MEAILALIPHYEMTTTAYALWPVGAYVVRDDPSVAYVFATPDAPGGRFSAIRVGGAWRPASLTEGALADDFLPINDRSSVEALLREARA